MRNYWRENPATKFLKKPHDLEYEKTFMPFILLSKKRYVGLLFEFDINKSKRKSMGIVLKRRDNAPIVKYVFGHVIEKIMIEKDFPSMIQWLKKTFTNVYLKMRMQMNGIINLNPFH